MIALALSVCALAGCGNGNSDERGAATAATAAPTSATARAGATAPTAPATDGTTDGATAAQPANPGESGAGDEQPASIGVAIGLANGGFTAKTPRTVHVPSFTTIELDIKVADANGYALTITGGGAPRRAAFHKPGSYKLTLAGLRPNRAATVKLGADAVRVVADAEPGP